MNVQRLGIFAFADSVGDFTLDDSLVELAADAGDGQLSGIVAVSNLVVDVPLVDNIGRIGIRLTGQAYRLELGDLVLFDLDGDFRRVLDLHVQVRRAR